MKVHELIAELQECDSHAEIFFKMGDGCCGETFELDSPIVEPGKYDTRNKDGNLETVYYCDFYLPSLPFLTSCISSSLAQRAVDKHRSSLGIPDTKRPEIAARKTRSIKIEKKKK